MIPRNLEDSWTDYVVPVRSTGCELDMAYYKIKPRPRRLWLSVTVLAVLAAAFLMWGLG